MLTLTLKTPHFRYTFRFRWLLNADLPPSPQVSQMLGNGPTFLNVALVCPFSQETSDGKFAMLARTLFRMSEVYILNSFLSSPLKASVYRMLIFVIMLGCIVLATCKFAIISLESILPKSLIFKQQTLLQVFYLLLLNMLRNGKA